MFVTVTQDELYDDSSTRIGPRTLAAIEARLATLDDWIDDEAKTSLFLIGLWTAYSAILELTLRQMDEPVEGLNDLSVLHRACSLGILSWDEHDLSKRLAALRDESLHRVDTVVTTAQCKQLRRIAATVFSQYMAEVPS